MKEISFKLGIFYDEEFYGQEAINELVQIAGDALSEEIKTLPGVKWAGGDADEDPVIYQLIVVGDISRNDIEAFLLLKSNSNGSEGDLIDYEFDEEVEYVNSGRPMDKLFAKGGFLYEVNKKGESKDLSETLIGAKNIDELKEKITTKYGSTKGVTANRRSKTTGAFYQVKLSGGGNIAYEIYTDVADGLTIEETEVNITIDNVTQKALEKLDSDYKGFAQPFEEWAKKNKFNPLDVTIRTPSPNTYNAVNFGIILGKTRTESKIKNAENLLENDLLKQDFILDIVGEKFTDGSKLTMDNAVGSIIKKRESVTADTDLPLEVLKIHNDEVLVGIKGSGKSLFSIHKNQFHKWKIVKVEKKNPPIESKKYPGQFTLGEDDGEKAMYTKEELELIEDNYKIELEFNASRRGKAEMQSYQKELKFETKLTHTENEFGGTWRIWKQGEKLMVGGKLEKIPAKELEEIYLQSEKSGQELSWVLKQYGYTMADFESSVDKNKMPFAKGGPLERANKWYDRLRSWDRESFSKKYPIGKNETTDEWTERVWKESGKAMGVKGRFAPGGPLVIEDETDADYKLEYISNLIRQEIAEYVEQGYHEGQIVSGEKTGWWNVEVEDTFAKGGLIDARIKMIKMSPDPNPIEPGTMGTIKMVDGIGQIHVNWDNGRTLAVVPGVDEYEIEGANIEGFLKLYPVEILIKNSKAEGNYFNVLEEKKYRETQIKFGISEVEVVDYDDFHRINLWGDKSDDNERDQFQPLISKDVNKMATGGQVTNANVRDAIQFIKNAGSGYSVHSRVFGGWNLKQNGMPIGKYSNEQIVEFAENIGYNRKPATLDFLRDNWKPRKFADVVHYDGGGRLTLLKKMYAKNPTKELKARIDALEKKPVWEKTKEGVFVLEIINKKGKPYSDFWVTIGQHKNKLEQYYPLWSVQRGGWDDSSGFRRTYVTKRFETKAEAEKFMNDWKNKVSK